MRPVEFYEKEKADLKEILEMEFDYDLTDSVDIDEHAVYFYTIDGWELKVVADFDFGGVGVYEKKPNSEDWYFAEGIEDHYPEYFIGDEDNDN